MGDKIGVVKRELFVAGAMYNPLPGRAEAAPQFQLLGLQTAGDTRLHVVMGRENADFLYDETKHLAGLYLVDEQASVSGGKVILRLMRTADSEKVRTPEMVVLSDELGAELLRAVQEGDFVVEDRETPT